jgi:hypothetical protein
MVIKYIPLIMVFMLTGCRGCTPTHKVAAKVKQVKSTCQEGKCKAAYAYQGDDGIWWWYWYSTTLDSGTAASSARSLPVGGSWVRAQEPKTEELEEQEVEVEISETADNVPEVESQDVDTGGSGDVDNGGGGAEGSGGGDFGGGDSGGDGGGGGD